MFVHLSFFSVFCKYSYVLYLTVVLLVLSHHVLCICTYCYSAIQLLDSQFFIKLLLCSIQLSINFGSGVGRRPTCKNCPLVIITLPSFSEVDQSVCGQRIAGVKESWALRPAQSRLGVLKSTIRILGPFLAFHPVRFRTLQRFCVKITVVAQMRILESRSYG